MVKFQVVAIYGTLNKSEIHRRKDILDLKPIQDKAQKLTKLLEP